MTEDTDRTLTAYRRATACALHNYTAAERTRAEVAALVETRDIKHRALVKLEAKAERLEAQRDALLEAARDAHADLEWFRAESLAGDAPDHYWTPADELRWDDLQATIAKATP